MKKNLILALTYFVLCFGFYAITHPLFAQQRSYTLLAPLPLEGGSGGITQTVTFTQYVNGAYRFILGVAGILAVIMIIFAGFTYMTTDAFQKKESGKEMISNAVKGLLLAIGTWIILNTINPNLLNFSLLIERPSIPTAPTQTNQSALIVGTVNTASEREARDLMDQYGLHTNKEPCATGVTTGCANFAGIPEIAFSAVHTLQSEYCATGAQECTFNLSGGTEDGHETHGINAPILDLSYNRDYSDYIKQNGTFLSNSSIGPIYQMGNTRITIEHEGVVCTSNSGPCQHFHVVVGQ